MMRSVEELKAALRADNVNLVKVRRHSSGAASANIDVLRRQVEENSSRPKYEASSAEVELQITEDEYHCLREAGATAEE
ncbi:MAG: hypothetical protein IPG50_03530 [Myxococcales bacterium]|nr:hypothetical protein [Myxococcales bacterium]